MGAIGRASAALGLAFLFCCLLIGAAHAAPPAGVVEGVARDALERPLGGAELRLEAPDGRIAARTTAGPDGRYRFTGVPPGVYSVVAEKEGYEAATAVVTLDASSGAGADLTLAAKQALDLKVIAQKLVEARANIEPRIGATTYTLSDQAIAAQPGGDNIPLNQTLLQAPAVSQDSFGQIHLRNDHANVQYRINGLILPEGISFFGQSLTSRFASSIDVITGSLPAQYGLYTTGIVDIQTKSGAFEQGGSAGIYGGSHGWLEPSAEYGGTAGNFSYYVVGDYLQNNIGIENPTSSYNPIHDFTRQGHGFAYFEDILDATSKIAVTLGVYQAAFQIPNSPGQVPSFQVGSQTFFDSALLNETQTESNDYAAVSYLKSTGNYDFQVSAFARYSQLAFSPDVVGDLMFNGIAQNATRRDFAQGVQADATYRVASDHTLRY
ncbi:MAG TPA: carboxypeptidase-like regulatory domain-containing protein, partial [Bradyrhizobium sp.]|nr:carboxypeptidase-like regulatory domain-containing protein [Bradyrhizobium sp.]